MTFNEKNYKIYLANSITIREISFQYQKMFNNNINNKNSI